MNIPNNINNNNIDTSRTCHIILLDGRKLDFLIQVFNSSVFFLLFQSKKFSSSFSQN